MPEKRKHKRAGLLYYLKVFNRRTQENIGHLADISLGGLKIIGSSYIPPGQDYHFRIHLPEDHSHQQSFTVMARSCWSKTDINPDYFASGFCFISLSLENIQLIKMLINQYELDSSATNVV